MPWYTKPIENGQCDAQGCWRKAKVYLFDRNNIRYGKYCRQHGEKKARKLNEEDR